MRRGCAAGDGRCASARRRSSGTPYARSRASRTAKRSASLGVAPRDAGRVVRERGEVGVAVGRVVDEHAVEQQLDADVRDGAPRAARAAAPCSSRSSSSRMRPSDAGQRVEHARRSRGGARCRAATSASSASRERARRTSSRSRAASRRARGRGAASTSSRPPRARRSSRLLVSISGVRTAFVGIDLGTQSLKAVVCDERLAVARRARRRRRDALSAAGLGRAGSAQLGGARSRRRSPARWRRGASAPRDVAALAIAGQLDGCVAGRRARRAAAPRADLAGPPRDRRAAGARRGARVRRSPARSPIRATSAPKIALAARARRRARRATTSRSSYLVERLTGAAVIDPAHASTTMLFDLARRHVVAAAARRVRDRRGRAARDCAATRDRRRADRAAPRSPGLRAGTPVAVGTGDDFATPLGAGVVAPGPLVCALGTAEVVGALADAVLDRRRARCDDPWRALAEPMVETHAYPTGALLHREPGLAVGRRRALGDAPARARRATPSSMRSRRTAPPGAGGVTFVPALAGAMTPVWRPRARGTLHGLAAAHDRAHVARAVLEGLAFACRDVVERLAALGAAGARRRSCSAAAPRSAVWTQLRADVARPARITSSPRTDTCAIGAAMLAAVAAGAASRPRRAAAARAAAGRARAARRRARPTRRRGISPLPSTARIPSRAASHAAADATRCTRVRWPAAPRRVRVRRPDVRYGAAMRRMCSSCSRPRRLPERRRRPPARPSIPPARRSTSPTFDNVYANTLADRAAARTHTRVTRRPGARAACRCRRSPDDAYARAARCGTRRSRAIRRAADDRAHRLAGHGLPDAARRAAVGRRALRARSSGSGRCAGPGKWSSVYEALVVLIASSCSPRAATIADAAGRAAPGSRRRARSATRSTTTQWSGSMHAYAADDPVFVAMNKRGQRETNGELGDVLRAVPRADGGRARHDHRRARGLRSGDAADASAGHHLLLLPQRRVGSTTITTTASCSRSTRRCAAARRTRSTSPRTTAKYDPLMATPTRTTRTMCGSCHDVVTPRGVAPRAHVRRVEDDDLRATTIRELLPLTCSSCHMSSSDDVIADKPGLDVPVRDDGFHEHTVAGDRSGADAVSRQWTRSGGDRARPQAGDRDVIGRRRSARQRAPGGICVDAAGGGQITRPHRLARHSATCSRAAPRRTAARGSRSIAYDVEQPDRVLSSGVVPDDQDRQARRHDPNSPDSGMRTLQGRRQDAAAHFFWDVAGVEQQLLTAADHARSERPARTITRRPRRSHVPGRDAQIDHIRRASASVRSRAARARRADRRRAISIRVAGAKMHDARDDGNAHDVDARDHGHRSTRSATRSEPGPRVRLSPISSGCRT